VTVILDGENAWEWYRQDNDAKEFLNSLYRKLTELFHRGRLTTVTMTEYIHGNAKRGVAQHPISSMQKIDWLFAGSWINANFDTWIGEKHKNQAWEYLKQAREDLEQSGIPMPTSFDGMPPQGTKEWFASQAWEELFAAEGSDWFWWYGTRLQVPGGTKPFDRAFIRHLENVYQFAKQAGGTMPERKFLPIVRDKQEGKLQGSMKRND